MGFKSTIIALLLVAIFAFAIFNFNLQLIQQNDGNTTLLDNPTINATYQELIGNLSLTKSQYEDQSSILAKTKIIGTFTLLLTTLAGAWTVFIKVPTAVYTSLFNLINTELFGGSVLFNVVLIVITAMMVLVITLYAIKLLRTGDPD